MEQGAGEGCFLLHAVTVGVNWVIGGICQLKEFQQLLAAAFNLLGVDFIQVADETQQFPGGELGIKIGGIREITADSLGLQSPCA